MKRPIPIPEEPPFYTVCKIFSSFSWPEFFAQVQPSARFLGGIIISRLWVEVLIDVRPILSRKDTYYDALTIYIEYNFPNCVGLCTLARIELRLDETYAPTTQPMPSRHRTAQ